MRRIAGIALAASAGFLALMAVLVNSPQLFYMGTALVATIAACRFQAWLSVRGLRFERVSPASILAGDLAKVEIAVWSDRKIRRPLITAWDNLPNRMIAVERTISLPIAPAFDLAIRTQYQFRPLKRGRYKWSGVTVEGTDALGLIRMQKKYETSAATMTVLPKPIPVALELPAAAGWGLSEAISGQSRGAGLEPRGIREYVEGDSIRHIHWPSSARANQLLVKEFEAGSHAAIGFVIQRNAGSEVGEGARTSLEAMCGHVAYLAEEFLRQGANVALPGLEERSSRSAAKERVNEIYDVLAGIDGKSGTGVAAEVGACRGLLPPGSMIFTLIAVQDDFLPDAAASVIGSGTHVVALLYDANGFVSKKQRPVKSATDNIYANALTREGVSIYTMPIPWEIQ